MLVQKILIEFYMFKIRHKRNGLAGNVIQIHHRVFVLYISNMFR